MLKPVVEVRMPYNVGDLVVHPAHGVGQIVRQELKRFAPQVEASLYYEITIEKGVVWVPVEPHDANGLRPLVKPGALPQFRSVLRARPGALNQDRRLRQLELNTRLRPGTFQAMCEVVRDLTARSWKSPLGDTDVTLLRRVQDHLYQEWAMAEGVSVTEATREVQALLDESRQASRA
jgi:CarD family transcriptional regulator, regulator of rRNA transcription